jgi:hypothetical protein
MISIEYVIAFAMAITNLFKNRLPVAAVPFVSLGLAIILNIFNALLFKGSILLAAKDAFCGAGIVVGIFNVGTITRKLAQGENPLSREQTNVSDTTKP